MFRDENELFNLTQDAMLEALNDGVIDGAMISAAYKAKLKELLVIKKEFEQKQAEVNRIEDRLRALEVSSNGKFLLYGYLGIPSKEEIEPNESKPKQENPDVNK